MLSDLNHKQLYQAARLYDEAFSWREVGAECLFMRQAARAHLGRPVSAVLELAAGPAAHAICFGLDAEVEAHALELSEQMLAYAALNASALSSEVTFHHADMCAFEWSARKVELAFCLMDSIAYITNHDAFMAHLDAVSAALCDDGLYLIECVHPKDALLNQETTQSSWSVEVDGRTIEVIFGLPDDVFDPRTQVMQTTVRLKERRGEVILSELEDRCAMKVYLYQELLALVRASAFEVVATWGAMDASVDFDDSPQAWRMVLLLQRR